MIEKKTIIDQIEITRSGTIQVRFAILLVEDGTEIDSKWHRTAIEPGGDVDVQLALVNAHLKSMGKAECDPSRLEQIKGVVALVHTPEAIEQYRAQTVAGS